MKKLMQSFHNRNSGLIAQAAFTMARYTTAFSLFACLAEGCSSTNLRVAPQNLAATTKGVPDSEPSLVNGVVKEDLRPSSRLLGTVTVQGVKLEKIQLGDRLDNLIQKNKGFNRGYQRYTRPGQRLFSNYELMYPGQYAFGGNNARIIAYAIIDPEKQYSFIVVAYPDKSDHRILLDGSAHKSKPDGSYEEGVGKMTIMPKEVFAPLLSLTARISGRAVEGFDLFTEDSKQGDEFIRTVYAIPKTGNRDDDGTWSTIGQYQGGQLAAWISVVYGADGKLIGPYGGLALLYDPPPKEQKTNK